MACGRQANRCLAGSAFALACALACALAFALPYALALGCPLSIGRVSVLVRLPLPPPLRSSIPHFAPDPAALIMTCVMHVF